MKPTRFAIASLLLLAGSLLALLPVSDAAGCTPVTNGAKVCSTSGGECVVLGSAGSDSWTCAGTDGVCQRVFHSSPSWGWTEVCVVQLYGGTNGLICTSSYDPTVAPTCLVYVA